MVSAGSGQLAWRNGLGRKLLLSRIESALLVSANEGFELQQNLVSLLKSVSVVRVGWLAYFMIHKFKIQEIYVDFGNAKFWSSS